MEQDRNLDNVASAIQIEADDPIRVFLKAGSGINRRMRMTVVRWTLGTIAKHDPCQKCGNALTRKHAVECSGGMELVRGSLPDIVDPNGRSTVLDSMLNFHRNARPDQTPAYDLITSAVALIYSLCKGWAQKDNGFWAEKEPP